MVINSIEIISNINRKKNSRGKTTLLRFILYGLGYNIPATEGIGDFDDYKINEEISIEDKRIILSRKGESIVLNEEKSENSFLLPDEQYELHSLLTDLELSNKISNDWLILLIAKTGLRFSEAIALTPDDFDFNHQCISVNKTWNYKDGGGFQPTKNKSSVRKVQIDWMLVTQFAGLIGDLQKDKPIFVNDDKIYNSTVNDALVRHCKKVNIPVISIHGLRHTHASLLLFAGVSIASVAKRLGHSSMTTTQKVYIHIIQEMENKDVDLVMRSLSTLC